MRGRFKKNPCDFELTESGLYRKSTKELLIGRDRKHVKIREGTLMIGKFAFSRCRNVETIECPNSLEIIGISAFEDCKSLKAIYRIPGSANIGKAALRGTSGVRLYFDGNVPTSAFREKDYIGVMTAYGNAHLKNGEFCFFASPDEVNIDPTLLYRCKDLIDIKAGDDFIIGLRSNGEVVYADVHAPRDAIVMLRKYGTIERLSGWKNIRQIAASGKIAVGRCEDGTVFSNNGFHESDPLPDIDGIIYVDVVNGVVRGLKENGECVQVYTIAR